MSLEEDLVRGRNAAKVLAEEIKRSPQYPEYVEAEEAYSLDEAAQKLMEELMQQRSRAAYDPKASGKAAILEQKARETPVVHRLFLAEEKMAIYCQDIAAEVNKKMQFDFGAACAPRGGCC